MTAKTTMKASAMGKAQAAKQRQQKHKIKQIKLRASEK